MGKDVYTFAANMVRNNPKIANSPEGREFLQLLDSHNDSMGEQLAQQYIQNTGMTKESALQKAMNFFGMGGN